MSSLFEAVSVLQTPPLTKYTGCPLILVPNLNKYMKRSTHELRSSDPHWNFDCNA